MEEANNQVVMANSISPTYIMFHINELEDETCKILGNYPLKARICKWVYNPLNKIVRRIIKMMRERRDILLIVLSVLVTSIGTIVPAIVKNWTPITAIPYLVIVAALVFSIVVVVRGMQAISENESKRQRDETKQLIKDTIKETIEKLGINNKH